VKTVTFNQVEVRKWGTGAAEVITTYPHPNIRLIWTKAGGVDLGRGAGAAPGSVGVRARGDDLQTARAGCGAHHPAPGGRDLPALWRADRGAASHAGEPGAKRLDRRAL
jgi:hypothetical protein